MSNLRPSESPVLSRMPDMRRSITRQTVKDIIADKLSALVVSGVLQIGDELPGERELAAALSVSRETIRGAIQTLAARGVVEVSHGSRTRVASTDVGLPKRGLTLPNSINSYDIDAVHEARLLVEHRVVAEAAANIDDATLARLDASLAAQRESMRDPLRFLICDREFHTAIYGAASNRLLADFVTDLYTYMMEHRRRAVSEPGAIRRSYEDHLAIVDGLRMRDPAAVVAAFGRHLQRIYTTTQTVLDALDDGSPRRRKRGSGRTS